jgi:DNA repair exonuclease SbcCD ATPase subunit
LYKPYDEIKEKFTDNGHKHIVAITDVEDNEEIIIRESNDINGNLNRTIKSITNDIKHMFMEPPINTCKSKRTAYNQNKKAISAITKEVKETLKHDPEFKDFIKGQNKKTEVKNVTTPCGDTIELISSDTPYERIRRAHNKLIEDNNRIVEKKKYDQLEIIEIQNQIEKNKAIYKVNLNELNNLRVKLNNVDLKRISAIKELENQIKLFNDLTNKNISAKQKFTRMTTQIKTDTTKCDNINSEVRRLKIYLESLTNEIKSNEQQIVRIKEQIRAVENKTPLFNVLKNQLDKLEEQKNKIQKHYDDMTIELEKNINEQTLLKSNINNLEIEIKKLIQINNAIVKQLAESESKSRTENSSINRLTATMELYKEQVASRVKRGDYLENELVSLRNQYTELKKKNQQDIEEIKKLEQENNKNKQLIGDLQTVIKYLDIDKKITLPSST